MSTGEFFFKTILVLLAVIGVFNLGMAFIALIEKALKELKPKWLYIYLIMTALGFIALEILGIIQLP